MVKRRILMGKLDQSFCCKSIWMVIKAPCQSFIEFESFFFLFYFILFYLPFCFLSLLAVKEFNLSQNGQENHFMMVLIYFLNNFSLYSALFRGKMELLMCKEVRCTKKTKIRICNRKSSIKGSISSSVFCVCFI